jgi:ATF/CREB family transcription factor
MKCRQKKKEHVAALAAQVERMTAENEQLQRKASELRDIVLELKALLMAHRFCE